jgi:hypothetical protein
MSASNRYCPATSSCPESCPRGKLLTNQNNSVATAPIGDDATPRSFPSVAVHDKPPLP